MGQSQSTSTEPRHQRRRRSFTDSTTNQRQEPSTIRVLESSSAHHVRSGGGSHNNGSMVVNSAASIGGSGSGSGGYNGTHRSYLSTGRGRSTSRMGSSGNITSNSNGGRSQVVDDDSNSNTLRSGSRLPLRGFRTASARMLRNALDRSNHSTSSETRPLPAQQPLHQQQNQHQSQQQVGVVSPSVMQLTLTNNLRNNNNAVQNHPPSAVSITTISATTAIENNDDEPPRLMTLGRPYPDPPRQSSPHPVRSTRRGQQIYQQHQRRIAANVGSIPPLDGSGPANNTAVGGADDILMVGNGMLNYSSSSLNVINLSSSNSNINNHNIGATHGTYSTTTMSTPASSSILSLRTASSSDSFTVSFEEHPMTPAVSARMMQSPAFPPELRVSYDTLQDPERIRQVGHGSSGTIGPVSAGGSHNHNNNNSVSFDSPLHQPRSLLYYRRSSACSVETGSSISDFEEDDANDEFYPIASRDYEWMSRSIESLLLGHVARAPILHLLHDETGLGWDEASDSVFRRRSTTSTFGESYRRRSSQGSFSAGGRRGSLSLSGGMSGGGGAMRGGTLAYYYNTRRRQVPTDVDRTTGYYERHGRRSSAAHGPMYRRRSSVATANPSGGHGSDGTNDGSSAQQRTGKGGGPNVAFSIMARESTGKSCFSRGVPGGQCLRSMGGAALYGTLDKPAAGIATEVAFLAAAIDAGDWSETHTIVSRLIQRLIGDPTTLAQDGATRRPPIDDPNLPPTAPKYYAGGGRLGLERDAFVQAGGIEVLIRMFREKSFVGQEMADTYDARDLSEEIVATRLATCWNEALAALRELVYFVPSLVDEGEVSDNGDFLPFLFTLLSHDSCFDGAAALIEEILSFMSQTQQQAAPPDGDSTSAGGASSMEPPPPSYQPPVGRVPPATTFFLGNVPDLYKLWRGFNCRQLAHFCRILALLVFEPEDRQLLESPAVLKSLELLQLRRNRATRAGRDSTVDMNQAILLGDDELIRRLLKLLTVMNFAPPLRRFSPYHVMAHFPFIADTLVMLGLGELDNWDEIGRQDRLARKLLEERAETAAAGAAASSSSLEEPSEPLLSELGTVADMLEGLSDTLMGNNRQAPNQIGHIIHVISAAQQAGVIVGRNRWRRGSQRNSQPSAGYGRGAPSDLVDDDTTTAGAALRLGDVPVEGSTIQGLASVAGILTDQILVRRLYQSAGQDYDDGSGGDGPVQVLANGDNEVRHLINTPEDAANSLQFNAMLLGPYQVEVLFVLCTLLGGRRKLDAQDMLNQLGLVSMLEDMFQRLPWYKAHGQPGGGGNSMDHRDQAQQPNGIHGPGCECTPESALCVQYLRLLHNFCDRDCDNYEGRRLLLSADERLLVFGGLGHRDGKRPRRGLLSKIIDAFIQESDESSYRFWLASCIESYLRGSSPSEQMFAAESGLLHHLVEDISSERLHCAGSLQTSFDLLGELSKGNSEVVRLLVDGLDEERFRKLMSVAAANLVDSNVFIRSLLLSLERLSARDGSLPLYLDTTAYADLRPTPWVSQRGSRSRSYLTHSWWDTPSISLLSHQCDDEAGDSEPEFNESRPSDWFPTRDMVAISDLPPPEISMLPSGLTESIGHFGWVFTPAGDSLTAETYLPNTVERLSWFLAANQARLLRDLLGVVDLASLSHETICCLNTAVVIAIFAHRRKQLALLLEELRQMNDEEKETKRRAMNAAARQDDVVDRAFAQAMRYLDLDQHQTPPYARRASISMFGGGGNGGSGQGQGQRQHIGDRADVMRNFREVLWFWMEYYTHRGRDRLSLEFSSHIRFQEWNHVVSLLAADDGSPTSLVLGRVRLPRSPYQRSPRVADNPLRGV